MSRVVAYVRTSLAGAVLAVTLTSSIAMPRAAAAQEPLANDPGVAEALEVARVWLEAQQAYERIPGLSAAVVHDQELLWSGGYGMAHPDRGEPATAETLYSICSISKLFTSVALMQLRDRGLFDLSDPVAAHLDWFDIEQAHPEAPSPTVEGILTHSAGLPREAAAPYWSAPDFPFPTREEIIAGLKDQETLYPAWRYFQYSNLGLTLAGELVRALSGEPYEVYVGANVLEPLGMASTYPDMPLEHRGGRLATGYTALNRDGEREPTPFYEARGIAPAAGYASTVDDLARFASWQFRLEGDREEVLHAHTLAEMHRVHYVDPEWETFWGLGFSVNRRDGTTFVGHGGSCPGYRSQLALDTDAEVATVFMANASGVNTSTYAYGLYDLVAPRVKAALGAAEGDAGRGAWVAAPEPTDAAGEPGAGMGGGPEGQATPDLEPYLGTYDAQPWGGETAAVRWKGGLALLSLPTSNPAEALQELRHIDGDTFRRVRDDGELGEAVTFLRDDAGEVEAFQRHRNLSRKIR